MFKHLLILLFLITSPAFTAAADKTVLAFGSCLNQHKPQPVWQQVVAQTPDTFLFIGDNVYIDSSDPKEMTAAYRKLAENSDFQKLRQNTPIIPIWDDHDYGKNDAGREFAAKHASKTAFLEFFDIPERDSRYEREGLYHAEKIKQGKHLIQVIVLDTRWFRDLPPKKSGNKKATILGDTQWKWLQSQLENPADLHIIVSSIQVIPQAHRWEKWANFPDERQRLIDLFKSTEAKVILLSGDRHLAEISALPRRESSLPYTLYELTSSGMNTAMGWTIGKESNPNRVGNNYRADNFGMLSIEWEDDSPLVTGEIFDVETGKSVRHQTINFH